MIDPHSFTLFVLADSIQSSGTEEIEERQRELERQMRNLQNGLRALHNDPADQNSRSNNVEVSRELAQVGILQEQLRTVQQHMLNDEQPPAYSGA